VEQITTTDPDQLNLLRNTPCDVCSDPAYKAVTCAVDGCQNMVTVLVETYEQAGKEVTCHDCVELLKLTGWDGVLGESIHLQAVWNGGGWTSRYPFGGKTYTDRVRDLYKPDSLFHIALIEPLRWDD
jgi:hypothetical protein